MTNSKPPTSETGTGGNRRPPRRFRLWEKKRGTRQTSSLRWGGVGEAIFFSILFFVGVLALAELVILRVVRHSNSFVVNGWGLGLSVLMLGSMIACGVVGAIYSVMLVGASAERRAALAKRASSIDLLSEGLPSPKAFPNVPRLTNWINSPGIRLAYRVPIVSSPAWRLLVVAGFCLFWNGAVAVLVAMALNPTQQGATSPTLVMVIMYALVGLLILAYLFRLLVAAAAVGPTSLEVATQPFLPGRRYDLFLSQAGHLQIDWLEVRLVRDEEVSFTEGTDIRSESKRVYNHLIARQENFEILPSEPFQYECQVALPSDAIHSFLSAHNAIVWKIIVLAESPKWPRIEREFPVVVYPHAATSTKNLVSSSAN